VVQRKGNTPSSIVGDILLIPVACTVGMGRMGPVTESTSASVRARVLRRILVTTVGVEAAVVGGYGAVLAVDSMTQKGAEAGAGAVLALSAAVLCAGLFIVVRATVRGQRGARAPIIVWQILQAAVAKEALTARSAWGVALFALAVVALVGACWPGVLGDDRVSD
jgi:hypothetical protein